MSTQMLSAEDRNPGRFHPLVFKVIAALAAWFVVSAWGFAGHGRTDLLLAIVSAFVVVAVGLPTLIGRTRRTRVRRRQDAENEGGFGEWASHDVQILTGPVKGKVAAIKTTLPIAAVAIGMTLFCLVLHLSVQ